jgi:hypothetical protein
VRLQLELPSKGFVWLFVNPGSTLSQFHDICKKEDPKVKTLDIIADSQPVTPDTDIHALL